MHIFDEWKSQNLDLTFNNLRHLFFPWPSVSFGTVDAKIKKNNKLLNKWISKSCHALGPYDNGDSSLDNFPVGYSIRNLSKSPCKFLLCNNESYREGHK